MNQKDMYNRSALFRAYMYKKLNTVLVILCSGANANVVDKNDRNTLLLTAAMDGQPLYIHPFVCAGADVNIADVNGSTPLMWSANNGLVECVELLIRKGADVNAANNNNDTALILAAQNDRTECVEKLITAGADVNHMFSDGSTLLMRTIEACDVNLADARGGHRSFPGVMNGRYPHVNALMEAGADVNQPDATGNTPLIAAAARGYDSWVKMLIEAGADVNSVGEFGHTPVIAATLHEHINCLEILSKSGADLNAVSTFGESAILWAVVKEDPRLLALLVREGADVNVYSEWNPDALRYEGPYKNTINVHTNSLFMPNGSNRNFLSNRLEAGRLKENDTDRVLLGYTPLLHAIEKGSKFYLESLLSAGANVNARNKHGYTPLMRAAMEGHISFMKPLMDAGANVNAMNDNCETALMCTVRELDPLNGLRINNQHMIGDYTSGDTWSERYLNHILMTVKILLRWGSYVNVVNNYGQNALEFHLAETNVHSKELALLLFVAGENVHSRTLERFGPLRTPIGNTATVPEYLFKLAGPRLNLKSLCREAVRRGVLVNRVNLFVTIPTLGLPSSVLNYLLYDMSLDGDKG